MPATAAIHESDYGFLLARLIDAATLRRARALAASTAVTTHEVLISNGWVSEADYVRAVAAHVGLPAVDGAPLAELSPPASYPPWPSVMAGIFEGRDVVVVEARSFAPHVLRSMLEPATRGESGSFSPPAPRSPSRWTASARRH